MSWSTSSFDVEKIKFENGIDFSWIKAEYFYLIIYSN